MRSINIVQLNNYIDVPWEGWVTSSWIVIDDLPTQMTLPTVFISMLTLSGFFRTISSTAAVTSRVLLPSSEQCWSSTRNLTDDQLQLLFCGDEDCNFSPILIRRWHNQYLDRYRSSQGIKMLQQSPNSNFIPWIPIMFSQNIIWWKSYTKCLSYFEMEFLWAIGFVEGHLLVTLWVFGHKILTCSSMEGSQEQWG